MLLGCFQGRLGKRWGETSPPSARLGHGSLRRLFPTLPVSQLGCECVNTEGSCAWGAGGCGAGEPCRSLEVCGARGEPPVRVVTPQPGGDGPGGGFVRVRGRAGAAGAERAVRMRFQPLACVPREFLAFGIVALMVGGLPLGAAGSLSAGLRARHWCPQ